MDFNDVLMYRFSLLTKERYLSNIKHTFVDESQDINNIQIDLISLLARSDPDQSI